MINALDNEDDEVRRLAAESLEFFDSQKAVSPLISVLKSEDATARKFAAKTLGQIGSKEAFQPLIDTVLFDNVGSVREEAARSLGVIARSLGKTKSSKSRRTSY